MKELPAAAAEMDAGCEWRCRERESEERASGEESEWLTFQLHLLQLAAAWQCLQQHAQALIANVIV